MTGLNPKIDLKRIVGILMLSAHVDPMRIADAIVKDVMTSVPDRHSLSMSSRTSTVGSRIFYSFRHNLMVKDPKRLNFIKFEPDTQNIDTSQIYEYQSIRRHFSKAIIVDGKNGHGTLANSLFRSTIGYVSSILERKSIRYMSSSSSSSSSSSCSSLSSSSRRKSPLVSSFDFLHDDTKSSLSSQLPVRIRSPSFQKKRLDLREKIRRDNLTWKDCLENRMYSKCISSSINYSYEVITNFINFSN